MRQVQRSRDTAQAAKRLLVEGCFALGVLQYLFVKDMPDARFQWTMLALACLSALTFFSWQRANSGRMQWLTISFLFSISYAIVCFQIPLLDLLGYSVSPSLMHFMWADERVMNRSVGISALGLMAYYVGAVLAARKPAGSSVPGRQSHPSFFLLVVSYAAYAGFLSTSGSYAMGEYTPGDASSLSSYFYKLFKVSLSALIIVRVTRTTWIESGKLTFSQYLAAVGKPTLLLLFIFVAQALVVGDRGPVLYFLLLTFSIYFARFKRVGVVAASLLFIASAIFLSTVGEVRQGRFSGENYASRLGASLANVAVLLPQHHFFEAGIPLASTIELAASVRTLNHSIANVPAHHSHTYGLFQAGYLYSIVPGVGGLVRKTLGIGEAYDGTANFISRLIQGPYPTYGDGTSAVADLYIDFGAPGVALGLLLFGVFAGRYESRVAHGGQRVTFVWMALLMFLAGAPYLGRSALMLDLSNVVLAYVLLKLAIFVDRSVARGRRSGGDARSVSEVSALKLRCNEHGTKPRP